MKKNSDSTGGYTLVELMIALVITGIMFSGIYLVALQTMNILRITRDESRAMQAAQYEMEKIRTYSWNTFEALPAVYTVDSGANAALAYLNDGIATIKKDPYAVAGITEPVYAISVTVTWTTFDGTEESKTVTSLATEKGIMR